ncbi:AsmA family protein [Aestuariicella sp. G3-2]|uniref:AsmA family protein n=1 Tax=Pseudomaricurvus albidus TaxID=2842452 RepID=UPI001C0AB74F|nr:AsmA family protein [Aestuariicella albida]MBU3068806.1 AsmA family protein [Aestuariicella albida]
MSLRRLLLALLATLGTLIVIAGLFLWLSDFRFLKPKIETLVTEATGREFRIDGDFYFKALPTPTLLIEQASLGSPDWGSQPHMLTAEKAFVVVDLKSLFSQPIVVRTLEISNIDVLYESNADGESNWAMGEAETDDAEPAPSESALELSLPVEILAASVNNVRVLMRKPDSDDMEALLDQLNISGNTSEWQARATGSLAETPIAFDAQVVGRHIVLNASAEDLTLTSEYDYHDKTVDIDASLGTLDKLGPWLEVDNLPAEALSLKGNVAVDGGKLLLNNLVASLSGLELRLDGEIDPATPGLDMDVEASGDNLSYLRADLPKLPFKVKTALTATSSQIDLTSFLISLDKNTLTGNAHFTPGDHPVIRLDARSELLDLSAFISDSDEQKSQGNTRANNSNPSSGGYVFDETPLPLEQLSRLDLDARLQIGRYVMPPIELRNVQLVAKNNKDGLFIDNQFEGLVEGKVDYQLQLKPTGEQARLDIKARATDFKISVLSGKSVPKDQIPVTRIDADLQTLGATPRALAANLNGKLITTQGPGRVSNQMIDKFSGDILAQLISALNPFAKNEEFTDWECSVFAIDFISGKGDISGFLLQSEKLMVVGGGEVDLNDETLNIEFNTKPRKGVGVSADMFVTPFVKLSGTLSDPHVGLNKKGLLLSGGAAFLTGGMSFLYTGLIDRATAEKGQCQKALDSVYGTGKTR